MGAFGTGAYVMGGMPPFPGVGGMASGGKAIDFPPGVCMLHVPDVPACGVGGSSEAAAGAAGAPGVGAAGEAAAAASAAGASGSDGGSDPLVLWCSTPPSDPIPDDPFGNVVVDDLEDGDDLTPPFLNGRGVWFTVNDGSGQQFPNPSCPPALPSPLSPVASAMHTYGKGFTLNPGGYSLLGISAKSGATCNQPVDASGSSGVQFAARGSGFVRFFMGTVETNPIADFGTCQGGCYDSHGSIVQLTGNWTTYRVAFSQVVQEGWGAPAPFNPAHILTLQWSAKPAPGQPPPVSCFDFWIDDVAFYR